MSNSTSERRSVEQGLHLPQDEAVSESIPAAVVIESEIERPGTDDHLKQDRDIAGVGLLAGALSQPAWHGLRPFSRKLAQHCEPRGKARDGLGGAQ